MATALEQSLRQIADVVTTDPTRGRVTLRSEGTLVGSCEVALTVRTHELTVDEPELLGGGDAGPNPVEVALAALASCWAITCRFWATKLGVELDTCRVRATGTLDVQGMFGLDGAVRPGLGAVELDVELGGPAPAETYDQLARTVDRHCPVRDVFTSTTPVTTSFVGA